MTMQHVKNSESPEASGPTRPESQYKRYMEQGKSGMPFTMHELLNEIRSLHLVARRNLYSGNHLSMEDFVRQEVSIMDFTSLLAEKQETDEWKLQLERAYAKIVHRIIELMSENIEYLSYRNLMLSNSTLQWRFNSQMLRKIEAS